jgi:hypothetical protein
LSKILRSNEIQKTFRPITLDEKEEAAKNKLIKQADEVFQEILFNIPQKKNPFQTQQRQPEQ